MKGFADVKTDTEFGILFLYFYSEIEHFWPNGLIAS